MSRVISLNARPLEYWVARSSRAMTSVLVSEYLASFEFPVAPNSAAQHRRMIRNKYEKKPAKMPKGVIAVVPPNIEVGEERRVHLPD